MDTSSPSLTRVQIGGVLKNGSRVGIHSSTDVGFIDAADVVDQGQEKINSLRN